jgi:hypothetical protein
MGAPLIVHTICLLLIAAQPLFVGASDTLAFRAIDGEERSAFSDDEILAAACSDYKAPDAFYTDHLGADEAIYYINTVSIHSNTRGNEWIELCTENWAEARRWQHLTDSASSQHRRFVSERETNRYFEFKTEDLSRPSWILYMRVFKCSYLDRSGFDRLKRPRDDNFKGWFQGRLNVRPLTLESVRDLGELLWYYDNYSVHGSKVLSSSCELTDNEFLHTMYVLRMVFSDEPFGIDEEGDTGQPRFEERANVTLIQLDYHVNRLSGDITLDSREIRTAKVQCNPTKLLDE